MVSGRAVGEITPSFPVLDVTGPHKGKSICYVCESKDAPVVFAFFRQTDDETASLVKKLDQLARQNKELNVVAVVTEGPNSQAWLERLARENSITIPLTVFRDGTRDVAMKLYKLNPNVRNTILVSVKRKVAANLVDVNAENFNLLTNAVSNVLSQK
ncbi:MAG: hypothetical protein NNA24_13090 [Nitrospira sp.]|nr:hypothetical protein [Nitrospira sp.]